MYFMHVVALYMHEIYTYNVVQSHYLSLEDFVPLFCIFSSQIISILKWNHNIAYKSYLKFVVALCKRNPFTSAFIVHIFPHYNFDVSSSWCRFDLLYPPSSSILFLSASPSLLPSPPSVTSSSLSLCLMTSQHPPKSESISPNGLSHNELI